LAALFVEADRHLAARTRSLFDGVIAGYDDIVDVSGAPSADLESQLVRLRHDVEEELALALDEIVRITGDGTHRAASALAIGFVEMKDDLPIFGTLDLGSGQRRTSRRFANRMRAMETLTKDVTNLRKASSAEYSSLAMELELLGLEARIKDNVAEYVSRLTSTVKRRAGSQVERVSDTLHQTLTDLNTELEKDYSGDELAAALRAATEATSKATGEAARVTTELFQDLSDDTKIAPLLDTLVDACRGLTPRYRVTVSEFSRWLICFKSWSVSLRSTWSSPPRSSKSSTTKRSPKRCTPCCATWSTGSSRGVTIRSKRSAPRPRAGRP